MKEVQELFMRLTGTGQVHAPDLLPTECTNTLWKYVRSGEYDAIQAQQDLLDLLILDIRWAPTNKLLIRALEIACTYNTSAYDACYVALAENLNLPLVTADNKLAQKFASSPYVILTLDSLFSIPLSDN